MRLSIAVVTLALSLSPLPVLAHGEPPAATHGGVVQEAGEMWLELVVQGTDVSVYVLDQRQAPMAVGGVTGSASVLVGGTLHKVALAPAGANRLHGTLPVAAAGRVVATVSVQAGGRSASARFMSAS